MGNATIRIGLIGAGRNTKQMHIPGFQAIDGVELAGVANRSRRSSQRVADEFGIPRVYESWGELVKAADIDAVCIGTWPYTHKPMVLAALENGKHVLTEARLALDAREAREMLDASRAKPDLVAQVVPADFTFETDETVRALIAEGYLGDMLSVDMTAGASFMGRDGPFTWRNDRDISGYNIMLMGAWYECLTRMTGPASSVAAITRVSVTARTDESGNRRVVTVPDHVEIICEMASGALAHMRFSEVTGLALPTQLWIFGSEGTLRLEVGSGRDDRPVLSGGRRGDDRLEAIDIPPEKKGRWRVEEEFINAIRGIEPVRFNTFEEGVRYMEFTEAVTRSAQTGRTVHLPLQ